MAWLLRDKEVLASVEAVSDRRRRLLRRAGQGHIDGVLLFRPARAAGPVGPGRRVDIAYCNAEMEVLALFADVGPWRVLPPRPGTRCVLMGEAGFAERCGLAVGDRLELRE